MRIRYRHTCSVSLRLDELVEVGLDERKPLLDAAFDVSATLAHVAKDLLAAMVSGDSRHACMRKNSRLRDKQRSASASAKIFMSSMSSTRESCRAKMPSRIMTCGEYRVVVCSSLACFSKECPHSSHKFLFHLLQHSTKIATYARSLSYE